MGNRKHKQTFHQRSHLLYCHLISHDDLNQSDNTHILYNRHTYIKCIVRFINKDLGRIIKTTTTTPTSACHTTLKKTWIPPEPQNFQLFAAQNSRETRVNN